MTTADDGARDAPLRSRLRNRLFHAFFLLRRPMTFGVRAIVHDAAAGTVLLVRHTYVPGWQLPGGGVEAGETALQALARELEEEGNITISGRPELRSLHLNRRASRRDHVALYLVREFTARGPKAPDYEIAEAGFFPIVAAPQGTTPATKRRLAEVFGDRPVDEEW